MSIRESLSIRREPTYLSTDVWRALWLLSKSQKNSANDIFDKAAQAATPDELADTMLRTIITEKYPQLFEHQKQIDKLERELIKTLGDNPYPHAIPV